MTIALFGYSHFTRQCAVALGNLGFEVVLFCPRQDERFFREAGMLSSGLPVTWFDGMEDPLLGEALNDLKPDFILSIIFNHVIPEPITGKARKAALNVHPAPLPQVRTASVWFWPLRLGLSRTVICVHHLTPGMDEGPVILRYPFSLAHNDTQGTHAAKLARMAPGVMKALEPILRSDPTPPGEPQGDGHWYPSVQEADLWINFGEPAETIRNLVRASNPCHPARTNFRGKTLGIHEMYCVEASPAPAEPGELYIHQSPAPELWIGCGDRSARLAVVAVPGEGVFSAEAFITLYGVQDGEMMGGGQQRSGE